MLLYQAKECKCLDFGGVLDNHLAFTRKEITFASLKGRRDVGYKAISYAWGEFDDREERILGHHAGSVDKKVVFILGSEWNVTRFKSSLVQLCKPDDYIWIDRLSLPQDHATLKRTLQSIPLIYTHLPVVIILPGAHCKCLYEVWRDYLINSKQPQDLNEILMGSQCSRATGACGWTKRIWTSQEFRYARSFRVVWADVPTKQCMSTQSPSQASQDARNQMLCEERTTTLSPEHDWVFVTSRDQTVFTFSTSLMSRLVTDSLVHGDDLIVTSMAGESARHYTLNGPFPLEKFAQEVVIRFLLGHHFSVRLTAGRHTELEQRIFAACDMLGEERRSASQIQDYVVSVFASAPYYSIPVDYQSRSVWSLLNDAMNQIKFSSNFAELLKGYSRW